MTRDDMETLRMLEDAEKMIHRDGSREEYHAIDLLIQELEAMDAVEGHEHAQFIALGENVTHPLAEEDLFGEKAA